MGILACLDHSINRMAGRVATRSAYKSGECNGRSEMGGAGPQAIGNPTTEIGRNQRFRYCSRGIPKEQISGKCGIRAQSPSSIASRWGNVMCQVAIAKRCARYVRAGGINLGQGEIGDSATPLRRAISSANDEI
jgi:hypothetical protein